ncbi:hypothetical protein OF001_U220047 [Pseudomonas sp. OF001]|nr:hypothetical protein OF001_U220047 [Pseudomonas sp. OF001]
MCKERLLDMPGPHRQGHSRQQGLGREAAVAVAKRQIGMFKQGRQVNWRQRNAQAPSGATFRSLGAHARRNT